MIALHKPERATYGQAVEAQETEYNFVLCHGTLVVCKDKWGEWRCCN